MADYWLKIECRIDGTKLSRAILLPKNLGNPGAILALFSKIEKVCKEPDKDKKS